MCYLCSPLGYSRPVPPDGYRCTLCDHVEETRGRTSVLWDHFKQSHPNELAMLILTQPDVHKKLEKANQ